MCAGIKTIRNVRNTAISLRFWGMLMFYKSMVQRLFYRSFHCRNTVCVYYIYACGKAANGFAAAFERYDLHTFSCGGKYSYFALKRKRFKLYHALLWQYIERFACGFDAFYPRWFGYVLKHIPSHGLFVGFRGAGRGYKGLGVVLKCCQGYCWRVRPPYFYSVKALAVGKSHISDGFNALRYAHSA